MTTIARTARMDALARLVPMGAFARRSVLLVGGAALGQGVLILSSPILTRLYAPADLGLMAAFTAILYVLTSVAAWRYELALLLPEDEESADAVALLALLAMAASSVAVGVAVWLVGDAALRLLRLPELAPYRWLLPLALFGSGVYLVLTYTAIRAAAFGRLGAARFSQSAVTAAGQIAFGLLRFGATGLLAGIALGYAGGILPLLGRIRRPRAAAGRSLYARLAAVAAEYRRFPLLGAPAALANAAALSLPLLALAALYGPLVAGWFALAQRIVARPVELVNGSIAQVYAREAATSALAAPRALRRLFLRVIGAMAALSLLYLLPLLLAGPAIFRVIFGDDWAEAGRYVQILAPWVFFDGMAGATADTVNLVNRQDLHLVREGCRAALLVGALVGARVMDLDAVGAVALLTAAGVASCLIALALSAHALGRHIGLQDGAAEIGASA